MGKSVRQPLEPTDFFSANNAKVIPNMFGQSTTKETTGQGNFSAKDYKYLNNPTPFDDPNALDTINRSQQPLGETLENTARQFGANIASSIGQGLANTFDLVDMAKTVKGEITGSKDDFNSSLFGLTAKEMQDWANGIAERHPIMEKVEGSLDLTDPGWWAKQIASSGTGIGMGIEALGTTALIEAATGGMGTAAALTKLGSMGKKILTGAKGAEVLSDAVAAARGMKSAATVYGIMSRASESRMEANQTYNDIYADLDKQVTKEGLPKYTKEEKERIASEGARRDYNINMALMPLDILSYRTMVFNPISGSAEGLIEKGLSKIGNKAIRTGVQWGTEVSLEGAEEGFQKIGQDEGKHYAKVLSGADDGTTFTQRLGSEIDNEFWNNVAGGVIGSPVIGGAMKAVHAVIGNNKKGRLEELHKDYLQNVGKMDNVLATQIKDLQAQGKEKEASIARRQFNANRTLAALHYDAMADKDTAFDAHTTFIDGVLSEINQGKTDALSDLGFHNPTPEQVEVIKNEFQQYAKDAAQMKDIYDTIKVKYNRTFVPEITNDHFQLAKLIEEKQGIEDTLNTERAKLFQYNDLSTQGKQIHDIEYQVHSLKEEVNRLTNEYRQTTNTKEKENINKLIEETNNKITSTVNRVNEINSDDTYTDEQKKKDISIVASSIKSPAYLQAIYDKNHLENEIELQRRNIALWNTKEYADERVQEIIKNAKTKQQARDAAATSNNPKVKEQAKEKETEITAQEAAQNITQQAQDQTIGDDSLFPENELINSIKEATIPSGLSVSNSGELSETIDNGLPEGVTEGNEPEALFSPTNYDFEKSGEEAKNKVKNGVGGLIEKLGNNISFEDLVRHVVKLQGTTVADNIFNALKYGWEANGKQAEDYDAIYAKVFGNPMDELMAGISQLTIQTEKQLEQATDKVEEDIISHEQEPEGFDNNNQPVYKYKGIITNESSPKLAFQTRLTHLVQTENEDGTVDISYEYTEDELNTKDQVDSIPLLDPDDYTEGTELTISVPSNFMDIKIPVYAEDGTKLPSVTFGQYVAEKKLTPDMKEYQDKIPMVIGKKGSTAKPVAFVHDIGWYHPLRFNQDFKNDMQDAIDQTRAIRQEVLSSKNQSTTATITGKRQTTFAGLKTAKDQTITLKEANPQTQLTIALTNDSLSSSKNQVAFPNNNSTLVNNSPFKVGQILEVRRYGLKDGKPSYLALPVFRKKLDQASRLSVIQAINIYANRANKNEATRTQHDKVIKHVQDTMGIDILSQQGLEKYLKHFINVFNTEKAHTNQDVENQAKSKLAAGTPYISIIAGGNIVFGRAGEAAYVNKAGQKVGSFFINPNAAGTANTALANLVKPNMLGWYEQNLDLNNLNANKPVITIGQDFSTTQSADSYNDYLLERLHTNIRSHNIGTQENPNYVTNIQPVITYDTNSRLQRISQPETNQEVREQMVEQTSEIKENIEQTQESKSEVAKVDPNELARQMIEKAKAKLGSDFKTNNTPLFSPAELTDKQRDEVASSINRIAGLTPSQQFDITNFMYNQITAMVNLDNKQVNRAEVDKQVDAAFKEVIAPLKEEYKRDLAENKKLLQDFPQLAESGIPDVIAGYEHRIAKIEAIEDSMEVLKQEAYNRVAKYTGITEGKVKFEFKENNEENPDNTVEEEVNDREVDFWTDVLTESPENKLTYSMRRFFGQVRNVTKTGEPITGFLGLPTYVGADEIIRTLMVTLADVPSSFDAMIAKLEERKQALPWMQEVIDKLKNTTQQRKNQFVTVMSNTSLRMKFTMISYNRKNGTWTTKVYDTNSNGVANAVRNEWESNFIDSGLVITDEEKNYILNTEKANSLINRFRGWKGLTVKEVSNGLMDMYRDSLSGVKNNTTITITPTGALLQELKTNIVKASDRMKFSMKGFTYQITKTTDGKYKIEFLKQTVADKAEIGDWLKEFGITLSPETLDELYTKGLYHNYQQRKWVDLFEDGPNTNGLFGILYNKLQGLVDKGGALFNEEGGKPLDDSVLTSLANLEAKYNSTSTPFGFRDNGKSFFALTAPKFVTDRVRDLKTKDSHVIEQLRQISFSQPSLWLQLLSNDKFRDKFNVAHIGANAFKELGKKLYRDNGITSLSDTDHELTKLGMFWDSTQGELEAEKRVYPGTHIDMRMATVFSPTMSDKQMMTLITTAVLNLQNKDLLNGEGISDEVAKILYEQTVKPELLRMIKFHQNGGETNISAYDKGAAMFLLMPEMNNIQINKGLKLVDAIKYQPNVFTIQNLEQNKDLMDKINSTVKEYVENLVTEKLDVWENNGLIKTDETNTVKELKFFDSKYLNKFHGDEGQKATMAAYDFVVNSMIANANSFMLMAGDPALYYKSKASDPIQKAKDTFVNVGKRLANQIAPGATLANSEHEKYIQIFIKDRESVSENIEYLEKLLGKEEAASYRKIEGADAQEYTTWKEHLSIMEKLGKTADDLYDITPQDIQDARKILSSGETKLTDKQQKLIGKVMQPIKPVYTGQIYDKQQDVMRTVYIKSSSFPLVPHLTQGFEIDRLRVAMEKLEKSKGMGVRASYQTANKVGSINNPATIWNEDGTSNQENINKLEENHLVLDRKNFRIQQEVPFKSGKRSEDVITLGTQLMKLLFGDEILNYANFQYQGKSLSGNELHRIYNDAFIKLVQNKQRGLYTELGLDDKGNPIDVNKSIEKLQSILKNEAINRGYPLQDIEGLKMDKDGNFNLPLWSSSNSNRYESMLNAIVSNRLIKMKFPGNSYVVGSEEGFKIKQKKEGDLTTQEKSDIIFTSAWNGSHLTALHDENGNLKKAQVFIASKFRDKEGNLIDLMTKENGEYKYVEVRNNTLFLKTSMFDNELLSLLSFRIPTSGHQSGSQIEIAGFLPHMAGDLMIVPRNFTKQKGLDFDVDKENTYQFWHYMTDEGKFEVLSEKHRTEILAKADRLKDSSNENANKFLNSIFGEDIAYTKEEIAEDKILSKLNAKIDEKLLQNEIVAIHHSVFGNPDIQQKINKTLNTDYAEDQADFIEKLSGNNKDEQYWTPLSDEYQKQKMGLGSAGKIGTGAYSLDVVGHSLFQQARLSGRPISLYKEFHLEDPEDRVTNNTVGWRFGKIKSDGILGGTKTLDGRRTISEVMAERQNVAVDNEKLQIMGRVNLNELTMDVDKVFNMLGFDKGEDGNSISFLFLSQPIIKDYVAAMRNANSNMAEFEQNKEQKIVERLIAKYLKDNEELDEEAGSDLMTNKNFIEDIKSNTPNAQLQVAVLRRFMEMKAYGIALRSIQTTINTDSKGLGKSFFDVIEKRNALNRLGAGGGLIQGASSLIGEYLFKEDLGDRVPSLIEQGYVDIGNYLVKPDTLSGAFNIHGVMTAYNLWKNYFPYDAKVTQMAFDEILPIISTGEVGDTKKIELKQDIFRNIKKYFSAFKKNGIIQTTDDINEERKRLYIDSDENTSLAKYIKTIKDMNDPVVNQFIKTNKLFNRFEFDLQKDGQPSKIKYNNAAGEEFDEQYLYEALASLIEVRGPNGKIQLPTVGNKSYTLDTLAQDLIAYSMLGNSIQEAIQFTKYIPVSYLDTVGYSRVMRVAGQQLDTNSKLLGLSELKTENEKHLVSEFTMQFIQHNPERVKFKLDAKQLASNIVEANYTNKKDLSTLQTFKLKDNDSKPTFVSIYNPSIPKGEKKFQLYWFDGEKYNKIPVLGTFGMDEYQPTGDRNTIGQSLINGRVRLKIAPQSEINKVDEVPQEKFGIGSGDITTVVKSIANSQTTFSVLANQLLPFVNSGIKIQYADEVNGYTGFDGLYTANNNTISISEKYAAKATNDDLAKTVLHEVIHGLTTRQIDPYITVNADGSTSVKANAPIYVSNLVKLFNEVRSKTDTKELKDVLDRVMNNRGITQQERNEKYGLTNIFEFMAMAMTEPAFQQYLSKTEFKQSGKSLLDKFKEVISNVLTALGVKFESDTAAAQAINSIFDLIENTNSNKSLDEINSELWEDSINRFDEDTSFLDHIDNELNDGKIEGQLSPTIFPTKKLDIKTEKCI